MNKTNFAINGVGRIGKNVLRRYIEGDYPNLNLVAVNFWSIQHKNQKLYLLKIWTHYTEFFDSINQIEEDKNYYKRKNQLK